jgi:hypothetical protein
MGGQGVWTRSLSDIATSVERDAAEMPRHSTLEQNFPNPCNPNSEIRYQISEVSNVRLAVYDLLGREVAVLVDEQKEPGSYQVRFDASGLSSGMYFCRLQAGSYTKTRKMLLVR